MDDKKTVDAHLEFLRDEGLELLSLFRQIRDSGKRRLILDLMQAIIDVQPSSNGVVSELQS